MAETPPTGILQEGIDTGIHPFDAWTFTRPSASVPTLAGKTDWKFSLPTTTVKSLTVTSTAVAVYLMPPGTILPYGGRTLPAGRWLSCAGQAVSRTTYATLFTAISTTWGVGNTSTTFNVPELRGVGLRGAGANSRRSTATGVAYNGLSVGSALNDTLQGHWHRVYTDTTAGSVRAIQNSGSGNRLATDNTTVQEMISTGTHGAPRIGVETRMATSSVQFIIAY